VKDSNGNPIKFHRLPKGPELWKQYKRLFKTEGFGNLVSYVLTIGVCFRSSSNDLPDVIVPESQYKLIKKIKYERVKKRWVFYLEFYQFQEQQCYGENEQAVHTQSKPQQQPGGWPSGDFFW